MEGAKVPTDRLLFLPQELTRDEGVHLLAGLDQLTAERRGRVLSVVAALGVDPDDLLVSGRPSPGEARKLAIALAMSGSEVIAIDKDRAVVEEIRDQVTHAVRMDSTDEEALKSQGLEKIDCAFVGMGQGGRTFESAIMTVVSLKRMGVKQICARAQSLTAGEVFSAVGATDVVYPEIETAQRWAYKLIAPHISEFLRERLPKQQGASIHTCDSYAYTFKLLFQFASERFGLTPSAISLEQIDAQLVMEFLQHLETQRRNCARTRNARLVAIKSFMRFVEMRMPALLEQTRCILAIPSKKTDTPLISYLLMDEMKAILNAPDLRHHTGIRDRAMLHLCFAVGLRVSELVGLPLHSVEMQTGPSVHIYGKGRKERVLPLWQQAAVDLRAWLAIRGNPPTPELFPNARGQPMTRSGFEYVLRKHVRVATGACPSIEKKRISPHVLRHYVPLLTMSCNATSP